MSFPGDEFLGNYENSRRNVGQGHSWRRAYAEGGVAAGARRAAQLAYNVVSRRKAAEDGVARLARVLTTLDLTALGVGSTLGVGVYVTAGEVAKKTAGPAVILSFLLAAIVSVLAGLSYAEFAARVPKAGSAYIYSYVCVGEFIAFIIGWNLILEYIIGSASVAKAVSIYLDSLLNNRISSFLEAAMPLDSAHLARYPDLFAFSLVIIFSVALAFGMKESTKLNNMCTIVNLSVVLFVIISGCFKADSKNWRIPASEVPQGAQDFGHGGFTPFGFAGIIKGAADCFYSFIGFDCVATAGEEAKRPQKSIPFAVVASLLVVFLAYSGVSSVLTLMMPYYMQDEEAPLPWIYKQLGWEWAGYAVSVGAICALCSSLLGAVFPLPRIIYAMSSDGLLFRFLGDVSPRFQTPLVGTMLAGLFTGTLAMVFKLKQLTEMMSIGTLLAYSMVSACVLLLRYERTKDKSTPALGLSARALARQLLNADQHTRPTRLSGALVSLLVTLYGVWCLIAMYTVRFHLDAVLAAQPGALAALVTSAVLILASLYIISKQPVSEKKLAFSVPLVPWLPGLSILLNALLMVNLQPITWARFAVWMAGGLIIYLTYGAWHSTERRRTLDQVQLADLHNDSQTGLLEHHPLSHSRG